jgi:glycosyltransferase involved in cell wall biosynthesis
MEQKVFSRAAGVGCYSQWAADSVVDDYGIDPSKVFMYVPCVPVPHAGAAGVVKAERLAQRLSGGTREPLRIVFVGNDWERKGGPRLLKWHQQHWKDKAELHVCSAKAPRDPSAANVVWHGAVPNDHLMKQLLPSMDVFVLPTLVDASPIAVQEAASCGLPVVSTRIAGVPELIQDGTTGFVCDRDDEAAYIAAIDRLIASPMLLMGMSQAAGRMVAQDLSSERWLSHLVDNLRAAAMGRAMRNRPETEQPTLRPAPAIRAA